MTGAGDSNTTTDSVDEQGIKKAEKINSRASNGSANSNPDPASEAGGLSDTHLKHVDDVLDLMSEGKWGRVFIKWRESAGAAKQYSPPKYAAAGFGTEEGEQLDDLRGIHWEQIKDAADRLGDTASKRAALVGDTKKLTGNLDSAWDGKAADAALEKYQRLVPSIEEYCDAAQTLSGELKKAAQVPRRAIAENDNIFSNPKHNSGIWKHYQDDQSEDILEDLAGMEKYVSTAKFEATRSAILNPDVSEFEKRIRDRVIDAVARANSCSHQEAANPEYTEWIWSDGNIRLTWDDLRAHGSPGCRDGDYTPAYQRIQWLDDFAGWYANDIDALRKRISDAHENTSQAWLALTGAMERLNADPFGKEQPGGDAHPQPQQPQQPQGTGPAGSGGNAAAAGGPTGSAGGGGLAGSAGAGAGGGGGTGGSMPTPPEVPKPEMPTPPEAPVPGESGAPQPGGPQPGTPQPGTGGSASLPPQQGEQVTVGSGSNRVTVSEPGADGAVSLTVPGENGQPETYQIAFGQDGQTSDPRTLPDEVAGSTQPSPGPVGPGQASSAPSGVGAPGSGSVPSPDGGTPVPVGPDGSAVIETGDRTITVEQTESGAFQVTMDDGDGSPQNYSVDFNEDQGADQQPFIPPQAPQPTPAMPFEQEAQAPPAPQPGESRTVGAPEPSEPVPSGPQAASAPPGPAPSYAPPMADTGTASAATGGVGGPSSADPRDVPASTTPQWGGGFSSMSGFTGDGMQNSFSSASGSLFSPADSGGGQWAQAGGGGFQSGATGLPSMSEAKETSSQGATGLGSMGDAGGSSNEQGSSGMRGGMMPMGGMGGAGGQQGGDEERSNDSPWRTQGQLFDDGIDTGNGFQYRAVLGDDKEK